MDIVVIGNAANVLECRQKFGAQHQYQQAADHREIVNKSGTVIFDFTRRGNGHIAHNNTGCVIFLNAAFMKIPDDQVDGLSVFGFAGIPTFLNRDILEVSMSPTGKLEKLKEICDQLGTKFSVVKNTVSLVTPRVICMIINEAFFAVEQGTATRADVDKAMKLGTNYPYGPFEWCQRIGAGNVAGVLEAVYLDTQDERYKICPLLQQECLLTETK